MAEWQSSDARHQRKAHRERAPQPGTIRLMSASASPEISDARALELARSARRSHRAFVLCTTVFSLVAMVWTAWRTGTSNPHWVVGPGLIVLLDLLLVSAFILVARSGAKAVRETSLALPDAYLVCQATDTNPNYHLPAPMQLVVQPSGVSLGNGRGTKFRPKWELAWADIAAADVIEHTEAHNSDTRPAVRITRTDGRSELVVLVDKDRRTDALMDFPRRVAAVIKEHAGQ